MKQTAQTLAAAKRKKAKLAAALKVNLARRKAVKNALGSTTDYSVTLIDKKDG